MVVQPREEALDNAGAVAFPGVVVPGSGMVDQALEVRRPGVVDGEEGEALLGVLDVVQVGDDLDRRVLQRALLGGRGVEQPVVAERVRHHVGGNDAVDPFHDEQRHASGGALGVRPPHAWDGNRRELADEADDLELAVEVVAREHGDVSGIWGNARHQLFALGRAAVVPLGGEEDGLARHSVGRRRLERGDLGLGPRGQQIPQPGLQPRPQLFGVAARPVHVDFRRPHRLPHQRVRIGVL